MSSVKQQSTTTTRLTRSQQRRKHAREREDDIEVGKGSPSSLDNTPKRSLRHNTVTPGEGNKRRRTSPTNSPRKRLRRSITQDSTPLPNKKTGTISPVKTGTISPVKTGKKTPAINTQTTTTPDHTHNRHDHTHTPIKLDPDIQRGDSISVYEDPLPFHIPGRSSQVRQLLHFLKSDSSRATPPCLYLCGASSTGKSLTITSVLSHLKVPMAIFHSREFCSREIFFTDILNQLTGIVPNRSNNYRGRGKCGNISLFVDRLSHIISHQQTTPTTCVIVIEDVEVLFCHDPLLVQGLLSVSQLVKGGLTLVLTSRLSPELLLDAGVMVTGIVQEIDFPRYSKGEVLDILLLECPAGVSHTSYHTFLLYVWKVLQGMSNSLTELRHLSRALYSQYMESVKGEHGSGNGLQMWYDLQPSIRAVLDGQPFTNCHLKDGTGSDEIGDFPELPQTSKYLLLASFLASNNPANTDKQYFSNLKKRRYRKSIKTGAQQHSHLVKGPGLFVLDRMLAIFYCIADTSVLSEAQLSSQLSTLVTVQYLSHVNKDEALDCPRRYRCRLSLEEALHVASTIGFDLLHHLHQTDQ